MKFVRIHDISGMDTISYDAKCEDDCYDEIDKDVFRLVIERGDTITMGMVIGEPIW